MYVAAKNDENISDVILPVALAMIVVLIISLVVLGIAYPHIKR